MQDAYTRTFVHLLAHIQGVPEDSGTPSDTWDMETLVASLRKNDLPTFIETKSGSAIELLDAKVYKKRCAVLLFGHNNIGAADTAYRDHVKNETTINEKADGQGQAHSAHLAVDLIQDEGSGGYRTLLEVAPRVARGAVARLFNKLLRNDKTLRRKADKFVRPRIDFEGELSDALIEALKTGRLQGIDFVQDGIASTATTEAAFEPVQFVQSFRLKKKNVGLVDLPKTVTKLFAANKDQFHTMRVRFYEHGSKAHRSVEVSSDQQAKDALYVRRTQEDFSLKLSSAPKKIVSAIARRQLELLLEARADE